MATLFRLPQVHPVDGSGTPYAGAKANFYATGTATPQNTYTDSALVTPHANPVVADADGRFDPIYLDPDLTYKLTLTQSDDTLIYTEDPVNIDFTADNIGQMLWPQTSAELSAGITPSDYAYPAGYLLRYGATIDGSTDDATAWQAAIDQNLQGGAPVYWEGDSAVASELDIGSRLTIQGAGQIRSSISYTGSGVLFGNNTAGRIYNVTMRDFDMADDATGTIALELEDVSTSHFENLTINGFATGIEIDSTTSGYSVYNRFHNVTVSNATTGWDIQPLSSNANTFIGCRANVCTTGFQIDGSNDNALIHCQIENCTTAISLLENSGANERTYIAYSRFEGNTTNISIGSGVGNAALNFNYHVDGTPYSDSGTNTQNFDLYPNAAGIPSMHLQTSREGTTAAYRLSRSSHPSNFIPNLLVEDTGATGNPTAIQAESSRSGGFLFRGTLSSSEQFAIAANGRIRTNQSTSNTNTPSGVTAYQVPIYNTSGALLGYIPVYGSAW